jgi:hypothetical protein
MSREQIATWKANRRKLVGPTKETPTFKILRIQNRHILLSVLLTTYVLPSLDVNPSELNFISIIRLHLKYSFRKATEKNATGGHWVPSSLNAWLDMHHSALITQPTPTRRSSTGRTISTSRKKFSSLEKAKISSEGDLAKNWYHFHSC